MARFRDEPPWPRGESLVTDGGLETNLIFVMAMSKSSAIESDYLVVGAGALGMGFVDTLIQTPTQMW